MVLRLALLALGIISVPALAQFDSRQIYPLGPLNPTDSKTCQAYSAQIDRISSAYDKKHQECLDAHTHDHSPDVSGAMVCSRAACQQLHDVVYGSLKKVADSRLKDCNEEVNRYQATERQIQEDRRKADDARREMEAANERAIQQQQQAQININDRATSQVNSVTNSIEASASQTRAAAEQNRQKADDLRQQTDSIKQAGIRVNDSQLNQLAALTNPVSDYSSIRDRMYTDRLPAAQDAGLSDYLANAKQMASDYLQAKTIGSLKEGITEWANEAIGKFTTEHIEETYDMYGQVKDVSVLWHRYNGPDDADAARAVGDAGSMVSEKIFSNPLQREIAKRGSKIIGDVYGNSFQMDGSFQQSDGGTPDADTQAMMDDPTLILPGVKELRQFNTRVNNSYERFKKFFSFGADH